MMKGLHTIIINDEAKTFESLSEPWANLERC
jgi:hypothetical protein